MTGEQVYRERLEEQVDLYTSNQPLTRPEWRGRIEQSLKARGLGGFVENYDPSAQDPSFFQRISNCATAKLSAAGVFLSTLLAGYAGAGNNNKDTVVLEDQNTEKNKSSKSGGYFVSASVMALEKGHIEATLAAQGVVYGHAKGQQLTLYEEYEGERRALAQTKFDGIIETLDAVVKHIPGTTGTYTAEITYVQNGEKKIYESESLEVLFEDKEEPDVSVKGEDSLDLGELGWWTFTASDEALSHYTINWDDGSEEEGGQFRNGTQGRSWEVPHKFKETGVYWISFKVCDTADNETERRFEVTVGDDWIEKLLGPSP